MSYIKGVFQEMKKVDWLNGSKLANDTWVVLVSILLFAGFFFVIDSGVKFVLSWLLNL